VEKEMPASASDARAADGTSVSPFAQLRKEKRPAKKPSARFSVARSGKVIRIIPAF
jgi:hypothetical protein